MFPFRNHLQHSKVARKKSARHAKLGSINLEGEQLEAKLPLTGQLQGIVFNDLNANGVIDGDDSGFADVGLYFDTNNNGQLDEILTVVEADNLPQSIPESGTRRVNLTVPEAGKYIVDVDVEVTIDNFFGDPLTVQIESPDGTVVSLVSRIEQGLTDVTFDDTPTAIELNNEFREITGPLAPRGSLSDFNGQNAAGRWRLIASLSNGFVDRDIEAFSLRITTTDEPILETANNGQFTLDELPAGTASINITPPPGFQTANEQTSFEVDITDGQITPISIPLTQKPNVISGSIFEDSDGNRVISENENSLAGWTVYADANKNGVFDEGEVSTQTITEDDPSTPFVSEIGTYELTLPSSGGYSIRTVPPADQAWTSYPLTQGMEFDLYGKSFFDLYRIRTSRNLQRVATFRENIVDFDYSIPDQTFFAIESELNLGTFDLETEQFTSVGPFLTDEDVQIAMNGISSLPNGELRGSSESGLYQIEKSTGRLVLLHQTADELDMIDYGFDGKLYGLIVGSEVTEDNGIWEFNPQTGERITQLLPIDRIESLDVAPNQQIYFTRRDRISSISTIDGSIREDREISENLFHGLASLPNTDWSDVRVSPAQPATNVNFAGYQSSIIGGRVEFMGDDGITGLADQQVYIDLDQNGRLGFNEPTAQTSADNPDTPDDESGYFEIANLPAGAYQIRQVVAPTFDQIEPLEVATIETSGGQTVDTVRFTNQLGPSFSGSVFLDANGNGVQDATETNLENITVYIDLDDDGKFDAREWSSVSADDDLATGENERGRFEFGPLSSLNYNVRTVIPHGWLQTAPDDALNVTLPINANTPLSFGLVRGGTISGAVFSDANDNGEQGLFERNVPGGTVFIDLDGNGQPDEGEPTSAISESGYLFETLPAGDYTIVVSPIDGFATPEPQTVTVALDTDLANVDFAATPQLATIRGVKWWDTNEDGVRDDDELGLSGFTIYVDLNKNGEVDPGEPTTVTLADDFTTPEDEAGTYQLTGLPAGNYQIGEVQQSSWQQTAPSSNAGESTTGRMFTVNDGARRIEERDPKTGNVINSFPWLGETSFSSSKGITLGPYSLFYAGNRDGETTIYEVDPSTGETLDSDPLPNVTIRGITYLNDRVYLWDSRDALYIWDPETDTYTLDNDGPFIRGEPGLASSQENNLLYIRDTSTVAVVDAESLQRRATINLPDNGVELAEDVLYAFDLNNISKYELNSGRLIESLPIAAGSVDAIAVGDIVPSSPDFFEVQVSNGQTVDGIDFGTRREPTVDVVGFAWMDENRNGVQEEGETNFIEGVRISVERVDTETPTFTMHTQGDLAQTPAIDETGRYTAELTAGIYRVSASHPEFNATNAISTSISSRMAYHLTETRGQLEIQLTNGGLLETIPLPEQPRFFGPQGLTVTQSSLFYVDGSSGAAPRIWELDRVTGEVIKSGLLSVPTSLASGLANLEGSLFVVGDSESIERYSIDSLAHQQSIPVGLSSIGGIVADPDSNTLIMAGFKDGTPMFARVSIDDGSTTYYDLDAPIAGGLAIVSGELLAEGTQPQTVRRFDLRSLDLVGTGPWARPFHGLASLTTEPNSHYIYIAEKNNAAVSRSLFNFALTSPETQREDVNGDGEITKADADLIYAAVKSELPYNESFDLNSDGIVDRIDIDWIALQLASGGPGDINLDGETGFADFLILSVHFGQEAVGGFLDGDINSDGVVSFADFLLMSSGPF